MKKRFLTVLFAVMTVCSMSLIFLNSSMNSEESDSLSMSFTRGLLELFQKPQSQNAFSEKAESSNESTAVSQTENNDNEKTDTDTEKKVSILNPPMRKAAHAIEFIPLGFSLCGLFWCIFGNKSTRKSMLYSLAGGILYAASDEFHQLFVDGRSCRAKDVAVDTVGVTVGILLFVCMVNVYRNIRRANQKP